MKIHNFDRSELEISKGIKDIEIYLNDNLEWVG
jgi:hypothetical protein